MRHNLPWHLASTLSGTPPLAATITQLPAATVISQDCTILSPRQVACTSCRRIRAAERPLRVKHLWLGLSRQPAEASRYCVAQRGAVRESSNDDLEGRQCHDAPQFSHSLHHAYQFQKLSAIRRLQVETTAILCVAVHLHPGGRRRSWNSVAHPGPLLGIAIRLSCGSPYSDLGKCLLVASSVYSRQL